MQAFSRTGLLDSGERLSATLQVVRTRERPCVRNREPRGIEVLKEGFPLHPSVPVWAPNPSTTQ